MVSVSESRREGMAAADELVAHLGEVVGFAVVGDPDRAVLVGQGLVAAFDVDDAQAAVAQADARLDVDAFVVRAAVDDRPAHPGEEVAGDGRTARRRGDSRRCRTWASGDDLELEEDAEPAPLRARSLFDSTGVEPLAAWTLIRYW